MLDNEKLKSYQDRVKSAAGRWVYELFGFAIILVLFFLSFGEMIIKEQSLLELLGAVALLMLLTFLIGDVYYRKGSGKGELHERVAKAVTEHGELVDRLTGAQSEGLQVYLNSEAEKEWEKRVELMMKSVGLSLETYKKVESKLLKVLTKENNLSRRQAVAILKARHLKIIPERAEDVLSVTASRTRYHRVTKQKLANRYRVRSNMSGLLMTLVLAYFSYDLFSGFSIAAFGWFLAKTVCIVTRAFLAQHIGFSDITDDYCASVESHVKRIKDYVKWVPTASKAVAQKTSVCEDSPDLLTAALGETE